uniref:WD repeat domain phosphoinositide-interacting protein 2-like isoform X1 n=1 Tax=Ciona intestinalis TaxID=7719 RepID=UPI000180CEDD|nr:WD repeat domain phosphoinositide-interacting protein 2-like isoform X1 [Ciona intestinalis]XP_009858049.1 WD repeat domain phosphoinositide-interacting protein 2-like isoform X1 [Ciona intestinalis]|eukprot:XP_009858048.1 WD repeat domain phosphoinositide-interacting protein 2-like isoform X1 [Ciona intestinalis]
MNLATSDGLASDLLFANFNQDFTSLAVGGRYGYRILGLNSVDQLEETHSEEMSDVCLVERLFSSSLVAHVSLTSPRKLKVCHFKKKTEICNYSYSNTILAVKLNRIRLVVLVEESLYIHNIHDMKVLHTIRDTPSNPHGICALSGSNDNALLAYPGSPHTGEVQIFDVANLKAVTMIHAHNNPLAALSFNRSATQLATASDKGTVIRVFSVIDGNKLFEFRRGMKRCVSICSLAFSADSLFLAASSNTETVHLFKLESVATPPSHQVQQFQQNNSPNDSTWMDYFNKVISSSSTYLPTQVSELMTQDRAFATVKLPFSGLKNVCALTVIQRLLRVAIASADGYLYIYNLDTEEGGECTLVRQHRLDGQGAISISHSPIHTYADAMKGRRQDFIDNQSQKLRTSSTGSTASTSSSDATSSPRLQGSPKGKMLNPIEVHDVAESLPLDDDNEFPPMMLHCD